MFLTGDVEDISISICFLAKSLRSLLQVNKIVIFWPIYMHSNGTIPYIFNMVWYFNIAMVFWMTNMFYMKNVY